MRKLLSKDYSECFLHTFSLPERDWENHYINFIEQHHTNNSKIIDGLISAVNGGKNVWLNQINRSYRLGWETDSAGNNTFSDPLDVKLPALIYTRLIGYYGHIAFTHIRIDFFNLQIKLIEGLGRVLALWYSLKEYEMKLSDEVKTRVKALPPPLFLDIDSLRSRISAIEEIGNTPFASNKNKQDENGTRIPQIKDSDTVDKVFLILKVYFDSNEHKSLKKILKKGKILTNPILFREAGNKLSYFFRQLIEDKLIIKCNKKELEAWLLSNFMYLDEGKPKHYTADYLHTIISKNRQPCKNPLPLPD